MSSFLPLPACHTPDPRIDSNYDSLTENRMQMYGLNQEIEASQKEPPAWVSSFLDSWDCGDDFCTVGRAEISADDASPFSCLEVSKIKAKANLVSVIQTDISKKIMLGAEGLATDQQQIKTILVEGFEVRNLSRIVLGENYYKLILKHAHDAPHGFYQCFSVAKISKSHLHAMIIREADKLLGPQNSPEFKKQMEQEWNRFFKIDSRLESGDVTPAGEHEVKSPENFGLTGDSLESVRENVVRVAKAFLKLPYQLGGDLEDGSIDCSNYVKIVYSVFGLRLPRTSPEQFDYAQASAVYSALLPGDLVFFNGSLRPSDQPSHVGIYLGENRFINANGNSNARKVQIDDLSSEYWQRKYLGARRLITEDNFSTTLLSQR